jgi:hypothetical protein
MNLLSSVNGASTTLTVTWPNIVVSVATNAKIVIKFRPRTYNYISYGVTTASMVASVSTSI